jgi:hypothetical protein
MAKDNDKKQIVLRISPTLWKYVASWAEEDFRSINGQIEFLLTKEVNKHFKKSNEEGDSPSS